MPTSTSPVLMPMRIWMSPAGRRRRSPSLGDEAGERLLHAQRGAHGPLGVVLVGDRRAEQGDDGVAEQLVDAAAERLDVGDERLEARLDEPLDLLGVEVLGERRVADEVGEQHGDDAPLLDRRSSRSPTGVPHDGQKREPDGTGLPHDEQANPIDCKVTRRVSHVARPRSRIGVFRADRSVPCRDVSTRDTPMAANTPMGSARRDGLAEVGDDVVGVFEADGDAQQAVGDADRRLVLGRAG